MEGLYITNTTNSAAFLLCCPLVHDPRLVDEGQHHSSPDHRSDDVQHNARGAVEHGIQYYNTERLQRNLGVLTPMEKHDMYYAA